MFSGGTYEEVARWLENFLTSHAKRERARAEVGLDTSGDREGKSYGATLILGERTSSLGDFDYADVARNRGSLAWCAAQAERARAAVRTLSAAA